MSFAYRSTHLGLLSLKKGRIFLNAILLHKIVHGMSSLILNNFNVTYVKECMPCVIVVLH